MRNPKTHAILALAGSITLATGASAQQPAAQAPAPPAGQTMPCLQAGPGPHHGMAPGAGPGAGPMGGMTGMDRQAMQQMHAEMLAMREEMRQLREELRARR